MAARGGAAGFALEEYLPYRLSVVTDRASRFFARRYSEGSGLSIPEWRVLVVPGRFGRLSGSEIAERTAMGKVNRAVRRLLDRGLVAREEDGADRRTHRLAMTRAGQRRGWIDSPPRLKPPEALFRQAKYCPGRPCSQ